MLNELRWLGHAGFHIVSPKGLRTVTDPFGVSVPYPPVSLTCDVVTVSHEHDDHNDLTGLEGDPKVLRGLDPGTKRALRLDVIQEDVRFLTVPSFHDDDEGRKRGENAIFILDVAGTRVVHLGDLGHELGPETLKEMGRCDVLLAPVGGFYTIDGQTAARVVAALAPKVVVPMHYKTHHIEDWPISGPEAFLGYMGTVRRLGRDGFSLDIDRLPEKTGTWVCKTP